MPALIVLADANVLVKDVVSYAFFDLAKAALLDLRWTPQGTSKNHRFHPVPGGVCWQLSSLPIF